MKKIFVLLLSVLLLAVMTSCHITIRVEEGKAEKPQSQQVSIQVCPTCGDLTFEDLLSSATDVIKGKCVDVVEGDSATEYEFVVETRYRGEDTGENVFVYKLHQVSSAGTVSYQVGEEYYLIMNRHVDVYYPHDRYTVSANLYIPVADIDQSTMYGEPLTDHSKIRFLWSESGFVKYLTDCMNTQTAGMSSQTLYIGSEYIKTNDTATIINGSDYVLKVLIHEEMFPGGTIERQVFRCTVLSSLKGDVPEGIDICVVFPLNTARTGDTCIVALQEVSKTEQFWFFIFSSPYSYYDLSQNEQVMQYIVPSEDDVCSESDISH